MDNKPKTKGTKQLFKNPVLESLTRTHIAIPLTIFSLYAAGLLYWSISNQLISVPATIATFFAGVLAFTLIEYLMHRFFFHLEPTTERRKKISYTVHGVHHDYPKDKDRLAMPPILSIVLATLFLLLYKFLFGNFGFSFTAGFVLGYAAYLSVHYMVHAYSPPKNFFKTLWIHHGIHHYKAPEKAFGVSSPFWDYVFRTMP